jgi:hypothetical protein
MRGNFHSMRLLAHAGTCALVLLVLVGGGAPAAEQPALQAVCAGTAPIHATISAGPPFAADRYGWFWTLLENTLHSRGRMLQFGVIGMCIALYFMFRARGN